MPDTERLLRESRHERDRGEAVKSFLRRFRHEISTPLSGASLHLEVALRRMQKPEGFDPAAVLENLRTCQQALETASGMLELIADVSREEAEEPATFSLSASLARAVEPFRSDALERGFVLEVPEARAVPEWFGSSKEIELVVVELTRNALGHSSPPGSIRWTIDEEPASIVLTCRSPGRLPAGDSEHLFGVAKGPGSSGRGFGLLRARRAAQSNGGDLRIRQEGDEVVASLRFAKEDR